MATILCPVDFSDHSQAALDHASNAAMRQGANLIILHAEPPPMPTTVPAGPGLAPAPTVAVPAGGVVDPGSKDNTPGSPAGGDKLQAFTPPTGVDYEHVLRQGPAADCILQVADERSVDQIVMGTHGRTGLRRVLLGSTAEEVVRKAKCPVTVVKGSELSADDDD